MCVINWVQRIFAAWILVVSAITAVKFSFYDIHIGAPNWLIVVIAVVETISASIFLSRANGFATAGLCSSFSAAMVIHIVVKNEIPWPLLCYMALALILHGYHQTSRSKGNYK